MSELSTHVDQLGKLASIRGWSELDTAQYVLEHQVECLMSFDDPIKGRDFIEFCKEYMTNGGNFNGF